MSTLDTTIGSNQVTVTIPAHGALDGDYVLIGEVNTAVGGIPAAEFNTNHLISNVSANTFTISTTTAASSTTSYTAPITFTFYLHSGRAVSELGYGWGAGVWSRGAWGSGASVPVVLPPRLYTQDRFNSDLIFCIRNADIYYWEYDNTFSNSAVLLSSLPGASDVPQLVGSILFSQQDRHLLTFGGTAYGTGIYDPLGIRWSNQNDPANFTPTATNSAGFLRVTNGSSIIRAVRTREEILIFTDSSLYSLRFLGTAEVFGLYELADSISIVSPSAVVTVNNVSFWMGWDKFYLYNGRVNTLPCTLRQYIFQDINRQTQIQTVSGTNEQFNEVIWFYPSADSTELNRYVIYNYVEEIWYYGQLERTAWLDSPLRPYPLGTSSGLLYSHERGVDADGLPMESFITSGDIDIEDGEQFMLVRRIIPDINFIGSTATAPQVKLTVNSHNFPGQVYATNNLEGTGLTRTVTATREPVTAIIDQYTNQVFLRVRGRQMQFELSSDTLGVQWQLGMPRVDARPDGRRGNG
jgi:hypothetical protein